jgi:hypothetical protein
VSGKLPKKGEALRVVFEGTIAAVLPSGTPGVWLVVANDEDGGVLRVALTDGDILAGGGPSVEIGDDGQAEPGPGQEVASA